MELAYLGRLRCRSHRAVLLRILRAVSNDAGFSVGESSAFWNWGRVFDSWLVPRLRPAAGLSRKDFRFDLHGDCCARCRVFRYAIFYVVRQVPASAGAPRIGQKAPDFILLDQNGKRVGLGDLLSGSRGAALIFYRGFGDCYATPSCGVFSKGCRSSRRVAYALSASASIRRILTSGNRKGAGTHSHYCPTRMRRLFGDTMCCIPGRDRKERISRARPNFSSIRTASFAG